MGLKLGIFGTFHPEYNFVGNVTTALALGLAQSRLIDSVTVFCQQGGTFPSSFPHDRVKLVPCWKHDDAVSLVNAGRRVLKSVHQLDALLFNTYVTGYGKGRVANGLGLVLPTLLSKLSQVPILVYMHNFVETQSVEQLGYSPSRMTKAIVKLLESFLLRDTTVIVPLESQAKLVESELRYAPRPFFFPFLESYRVAKQSSENQSQTRSKVWRKPRILLMGTWGPQKDLSGALEALSQLCREGLNFEVTIIGAINLHFPGFFLEFNFDAYPALSGRLQVTGPLKDEELFEVVQAHDLLLLPYRATGGYSGVMNFAGVTGIPIVAYDHPQLREQARLLDIKVTFVSRENLVAGVRACTVEPQASSARDHASLLRRVHQTEEAMVRFVERLEATARKNRLPAR